MQLKVDSSAIQKYSHKLQSLSRSAFPVAVRQTLNNAAFDMKVNTMPSNAKKSFIERKPTFFKANSKVDQATGFNVGSMKATTGFFNNSLKGSPAEGNFAIKDLEQQETGGQIKKKSLIPMLAARSGGSRTLVRSNARLQKIKNVVKAAAMGRANPKVNFILAAHRAGKGGYFLSKNTLFRVDALNFKNSADLKLTPLYSFKRGRSVHVKSHKFVEKSGIQSGNKMDDYFIRNAEKQFEKALK